MSTEAPPNESTPAQPSGDEEAGTITPQPSGENEPAPSAKSSTETEEKKKDTEPDDQPPSPPQPSGDDEPPAPPPKSEPVEPPKSEPAEPPKSEPAPPPKSEPAEPPKSEPAEPPKSEPAAPPKSEAGKVVDVEAPQKDEPSPPVSPTSEAGTSPKKDVEAPAAKTASSETPSATETTPLLPKSDSDKIDVESGNNALTLAGGNAEDEPLVPTAGMDIAADIAGEGPEGPKDWKDQLKLGVGKTGEFTKEYGGKALVAGKAGAKVAGKYAHVTADYTKEKAGQMAEFVMDGPVSFRMFAFVGGLGIIAGSIRDMVEKAIYEQPLQTFISMFYIYFGAIILLLESRALFKRTPFREDIYESASFLRTTFGRGCFYTFVGLDIASHQYSWFSGIAGMYLLALGLIGVLVGYCTQNKLTNLRNAIKDEEMVKKAFEEVDTENTGYLNAEQFAEVCEHLGVPMKKIELLAVFDVIDTSNDNKITLEEFQYWWSEWDELAEVI